MKIYDEVVDKVGDLGIDLGKAAVIAGFAGVFIEKRPIISSGTIVVGLILIFGGLYAFHLKNRRKEEIDEKIKETKNEEKDV